MPVPAARAANEATQSTRTPIKIKSWDGGMMGHRMPPMIKLVKTKPE